MILDGKKLSSEIIKEIKSEVSSLKHKPKIVDIVIGQNNASNLFVKNKHKACVEVGIEFELVCFDSKELENNIIEFIKQLNDNQSVDAIMVQLPIPSNFNAHAIINAIDPSKDVDGLTQDNQMKLFNNHYDIIPCTPKGIIRILNHYHIPLIGKHVVIIGRGELIGKPLAQCLLNENATVTICHSKTTNLKQYTKNADILICAANKANIITEDMVEEECILIDAGTVYENNKLYSNVDKNVFNKVKSFTPVPGGIGPMTVAMFLENVLLCYNKIRNKKVVKK